MVQGKGRLREPNRKELNELCLLPDIVKMMKSKKSNKNFKTTIPNKNYDRPKTARECGIF